MSYLIIALEHRYPTETGYDPQVEVYDSMDEARAAAMDFAARERQNFYDVTKLDATMPDWNEPTNGDKGSAIITASNGTEPWFFVARVLEVQDFPQ